MFKRRSSKDLSAKIGYDNVNGKASRNPSLSSIGTSAVAPVANIVPGHQKQSSFSSYRRTTGMPSPEGDSGATTDTASNSTGPSPLAAMKPVPPSAQQPQQQQEQQSAVATTVAASSTKAPSKPKSAPKAVAEPPSKSLVIGEGVLFEGSTEGCAAAVVGGKLVGTVKSRRLEITRAGKMEGTAYAETAEIAGTFEGNLVVTKALKICSTGRFKGDVSFGSIVVENGGKLEGKVNFAGSREPMPKSSDVPAMTTTTTTTTTAAAAAAAPSSKKTLAASADAAAAAAANIAPPSTAPLRAAAPMSSGSSTAPPVAALAPVEDGRQSPE
eukprot:g8199.t1